MASNLFALPNAAIFLTSITILLTQNHRKLFTQIHHDESALDSAPPLSFGLALSLELVNGSDILLQTREWFHPSFTLSALSSIRSTRLSLSSKSIPEPESTEPDFFGNHPLTASSKPFSYSFLLGAGRKFLRLHFCPVNCTTNSDVSKVTFTVEDDTSSSAPTSFVKSIKEMPYNLSVVQTSDLTLRAVDLPSLLHLHFGDNFFSGSIPPQYGSWGYLQYLWENNFTENILARLGASELQLLDLSGNKLAGIQKLLLNQNFNGSILEEVGKLQQLSELGKSCYDMLPQAIQIKSPFMTDLLPFNLYKTKIASIIVDNKILFNNIDTSIFIIPTSGTVATVRFFLHSSLFAINHTLVHFLFDMLDFTLHKSNKISISIVTASSLIFQSDNNLHYAISSRIRNRELDILSSTIVFSLLVPTSYNYDNKTIFDNIVTSTLVILNPYIVATIRYSLHSYPFPKKFISIRYIFDKFEFALHKSNSISLFIVTFSSLIAQLNDNRHQVIHYHLQNANTDILSSPHITLIFTSKTSFDNTPFNFTRDKYSHFVTIGSISDLEDKVDFEGSVMIGSNEAYAYKMYMLIHGYASSNNRNNK